MKTHEYSFPWTNLWFLKTEIPIFIYIHHLFMNHILWIYSWIKFMKCLDEPVMNQSWIYHEYSWRVHKSSLSYEFHLAGVVINALWSLTQISALWSLTQISVHQLCFYLSSMNLSVHVYWNISVDIDIQVIQMKEKNQNVRTIYSWSCCKTWE